ncbi:methyl-accepting chemotaxis protein [Vibrio tapetis subsp. quintayensis]|uniref:methyl-accepting chemotaxis protein n=1 Tax=Vibrio tapetis TaxID=52443 RepID=UPI0025B2DE55|nr:methyl-accepting chemotaxis protein [Vibrio tapetis]MDN3681777.1 methyl-accepting chemotaxis protein [Vibrio tapetis subsp. quintayensis]
MQWLRDLAISRKVLVLISIMLVLLAITAGYAVSKMSLVGHEIEGIAQENMPLVQITSDITIKQLESAVVLEKALRYAQVSGDHSLAEIKSLEQENHRLGEEVDKELEQAKDILIKAMSHALTPEILAIEQKLLKDLERIKQEHKDYEKHSFQVLDAITHGETASIDGVVAQLESEQDELNHELSSFLLALEKVTEDSILYTQHEEEMALKGMILIASISALVGLGIGVLLSRSISIPLKQAANLADHMAHGDFSRDIKPTSKDEVGQLLSSMSLMAGTLRKTMHNVAQSAEKITRLVEEVNQLTEANSQAIYSQQQNTEQVATAMSEMAATVNEVASSANGAASATDQADDQLQQGNSTVVITETANEKLAKISEASSEKMDTVKESTAEIGGIVQVINSIAEQTNLLALNAAIESARAGEQGRGFAVVADEVRALAGRTQDATQEIQKLIGELQVHATSAVESIQESTGCVAESVSHAVRTKEAFASITEVVGEISKMNTQIATASEEQSVVAEQISQNLEAIKESGAKVLHSSEVTSQRTDNLNGYAQDLKQLMGQFKV